MCSTCKGTLSLAAGFHESSTQPFLSRHTLTFLIESPHWSHINQGIALIDVKCQDGAVSQLVVRTSHFIAILYHSIASLGLGLHPRQIGLSALNLSGWIQLTLPPEDLVCCSLSSSRGMPQCRQHTPLGWRLSWGRRSSTYR